MAGIDFAAIVAGLTFAVSIVNPKNYSTTATKELANVQDDLEKTGQMTPDSVFFHAFVELEKLVREALKARELYVPSRGAPQMSYSFRRMVDALYQNELISSALRQELLEVNRYRNLVFHGHASEVDQAMVERVQLARQHFTEELSSDV